MPAKWEENSSITIRPALENDCPLIHRFIVALAEYEKLSHEVTGSTDDLRRTLFGAAPAAQVVIAEWQGEPAGFALYFTNYSTFLARPGIYLEDLFVLPEYRGKGLGKALLSHLAALVVMRDGGRLDWSVLDWNAPAIDFYRSLGAIAMDDWTTFRLSGVALTRVAESRSSD